MSDIAVQAAAPGQAGRIWRAYGPLIAVWLIYYLGLQVALAPFETPVTLYSPRFVPTYLSILTIFIVLAAVTAYVRLVVLRGDVPRAERFRSIARETNWLEVLILGPLPVLVYVFTLMRMFKSFKPHIPDLVPFSWDPLFRNWDQVLLLGWDGWEITHAILPWHYGTVVVDAVYFMWFFVIMSMCFSAGFRPLTSRLRLTCLMSFALNWMIAGSVLAVAFSSVGPIYYDKLLGDPAFLPMIERLLAANEISPLATVRGIDLLWNGYIQVEGWPRFGISAFPSMHVCIAMQVYLYCRASGRGWGWLGLAFVGFTLFGSVHLGWHWLVDGLASILISWLVWKACWRFAEWWLPESG